jgi:phage terminase large subunit-like protein
MPCDPIFPEQARIGLEVFNSLLAVGVPNPNNEVDEYGRPKPPTYGQVCRPWLTEIAAVIHGAYDVETGDRLIREVLLKVAKKNWKSGLAGGLVLSLMVLNWRQSNEGAVIAPTKETADNVFKPIRDAVNADPEMAELFHIQPNIRTVTHRVTGMSVRVYAADTDTIAGKIWAFVIFEELWLLAQRKGAEDLLLEATGGQASRPEGIVISITTESDDDPVGIYKAKLEFARAVRDGAIHAPHFLPLLYEWPADLVKSKAYLKPENFHLVNPNWGASVDPEDFLRKFEEAKLAGGASLRVFLAKRLSVPPSENMGGSWPGSEFWTRRGDKGLTFKSLLARSEVVVVGIDGGGLDDLLALAAVGREKGTRKWLHWAHAWAHEIVLQRRKDLEPQLRDFEQDGDLTIVALPGQDVEELANYVQEINEAGLLPDKHAIGVDSAGIGAVVDELTVDHRGMDMEQIIAVSQGWKLNGAIKTTERSVAGGDFIHGAQPLMAWAVGNAKVVPVGNAVTITKQAAGTAKIDPLMATFNAVTLMALNPEARAYVGDFLTSPVTG